MSYAPYSVSAFFEVGLGPTQPPYHVEITQAEYAHDVALLRFWAQDVESASFQSGVPVRVLFGRPGVQRTFYGYVDHTPRYNAHSPSLGSKEEANSVDVYCVGASWYMKSAAQGNYGPSTIPQAIAAVGAQFGLSSQVAPHPVRWDSLMAAGQTYFQFCVSAAQKIGYTFYCNGVQLVAAPRSTDPLKLTNLAAVYDYRTDPASIPSFSPVLGAANQRGGHNRQWRLGGVDPATAGPLVRQQVGSPFPGILGAFRDMPVFAGVVSRSARSREELEATVGGVGASNQLYITASATVIGDPNVHQGSVVVIRNVNGSLNNLWYVTQVTHVFSRETYLMNLELGSDSRGVPPAVSVPVQTSISPSAVLIGGQWRAR